MKACVCFLFFSFRGRVLSRCVAGGLQWGGVGALTPVLLLFHLLQSEDPLLDEGLLCLPVPYPEHTATRSQPQGKGQQLAGDPSAFLGLLSVYIIVV